MKKSLLLLFSLSCSLFPNHCFPSEEDIGTTAFPVLELGFGARGAGMGNAFCALSDDISALWWNPAGLGQLKLSEASFSHQEWFQGFRDEYGGAGITTPFGTIAAGVLYSSVSDVIRHTEFDNPVNFKTYDVIGSLAYGTKFKRNFFFGFSMLGYYVNLDEDIGKAVGADLGLLWRPGGKFGIGLTAQNFGTPVKYYYHDTDPLPSLIKAGISISPSSKINGVVEYTYPQFGVQSFGVGMEWWITPMIAVRGGYRGGPQASEIFTAKDALSLGFGIRYKMFGLDYAYAPYADVGMTHRISVNYVFGRPAEIRAGTIIARVIDVDTKKPLQAIITTRGPRADTVLTSPESGEKQIIDMPVGTIIVKAEKDFYIPAEDTLELAQFDIKKVEIPLKYKGPKDVPRDKAVIGIFGKVSSVSTGAPIMAEVKYDGPVSGTVVSDMNGWYSIPKIPVGMYTLTVESQKHDYFPKLIKEVVVEKDKGTLTHAEMSKVKTLRLYFERDRAYVHPNDRAVLDTLSSFMQKYKENVFEIQGHTDPRPPTKFKNNMELSNARANAVRTYLIARDPALAGRLTAKGYGADKPVASNDTEEGMATNRRIEIIMLPSAPAPVPPVGGQPPDKK